MDADLQRRLLELYAGESAEHLKALETGLGALRDASDPAPILDTIFRAAHSLKGAARAVDDRPIETLCDALETFFAALKASARSPSLAQIAAAVEVVDRMLQIVSAPEPARTAAYNACLPLLAQLDGGRAEQPSRTEPAAPRPAPDQARGDERPAGQSDPRVRLAVERLDLLLSHAEDLLSARLDLRHRAREAMQLARELAAFRTTWERRRDEDAAGPASGSMPAPGNGAGDARAQYELSRLGAKVEAHARGLDHVRRQLERTVDDLHGQTRALRLTSIDALFEGLPRMVRELAREQGKEIDVRVAGGSIDVDRYILDEIRNPIVHLLRNSVDHGIELPEARIARGKSRTGVVEIGAAPDTQGKIRLTLQDDGAGLDLVRVREAAVKAGAISADEAERLPDGDAIWLACAPGVSTSAAVTRLSGRGLGLAIVREQVERVGGIVDIETAPGRGLTVTLRLPSTLTRFHGVVVRVEQQRLVVPVAAVARALRLRRDEVATVQSRDAISFEGRSTAVVWLADVLGVPRTEPPPLPERGAASLWHQALFLQTGGSHVLVVVDDVEGEQEMVIKRLGSQVSHLPHLLGAAMLGTGEAVLVLNPSRLLAAARRSGARPAAEAREPGKPSRRLSLLIVEDSVTARSLLRQVLESAGYDVRVAVDGLDAFAQLKSEPVDAVISDVEMPRLNGLDLTARIRADRQIADIPVVLVTALESREHRQRGLEAGANAYLVKSRFDQSELLNTIRRLV